MPVFTNFHFDLPSLRQRIRFYNLASSHLNAYYIWQEKSKTHGITSSVGAMVEGAPYMVAGTPLNNSVVIKTGSREFFGFIRSEGHSSRRTID